MCLLYKVDCMEVLSLLVHAYHKLGSIMTSSFTLNRDFLLGAHVCILLLHGGHAGVQQCTMIDEKKALSLSLWSNA